MSYSTFHSYIHRVVPITPNIAKSHASYDGLLWTYKNYRPNLHHHALKRYSSSIPHQYEEMTSRQLPYIRDHVTPGPVSLLNATIDDLIPHVPHEGTGGELYPGSHLVYFPPETPLKSLLPDGTDPLHSPGRSFDRRMWAGGSMEFLAPVMTDCWIYHLTEKIVDICAKGQGDKRKIFVKIQRKIFRKKQLPLDDNNNDENLCVRETRNLCFMRNQLPDLATDEKRAPSKVLRPEQTPDRYHKLVPTAALLFRFSALTFNAHAIHLDKKYCQETEGHRNLLVHGPLSVLLLLQFLRAHLRRLNDKRRQGGLEVIDSIEYRNLAPLYAEEEMTICLKRKIEGLGAGSFDVWIVGPDGGYAVKGVVRTVVKPKTGSVAGEQTPVSDLDEAETVIRKVAAPEHNQILIRKV